MTVLHFFNCAILTFGPHVVYYTVTPLSEYDTVGTSVKAAVVYLVTALLKLICFATFPKVSENDNYDPYQELVKTLIGFIDVAGLYFALTQLTYRNISQNHKFQAVGLGVEAVTCCNWLLELSQKKLTQDIDTNYLRFSCTPFNNAINHELLEKIFRMESPRGCGF